jgi:hypothetical protein
MENKGNSSLGAVGPVGLPRGEEAFYFFCFVYVRE